MKPPRYGTWRELAQMWRGAGLTPAPPPTITIAAQVSGDPPAAGDQPPDKANEPVARVALAADESITVPPGYKATSWTAQLTAFRGPAPYDNMEAWVTVGGSPTSQATVWAQAKPNPVDWHGYRVFGSPQRTGEPGSVFDVGEICTGAVPVAVYVFEFMEGFVCNINVTCELMDETYAQWQQDTFDRAAATYQSLLDAHNQERDTRSQQVSGQPDLAGPPELNQARAVNELRRLVIQELLGKPFSGKPAIEVDKQTDEPSVSLRDAKKDAPLIQFMEQAFEWENLVYICYPYYWARKDQWVTDAVSASADPEFDQFVNAGSARVVVPARPGFENLVNYYLYTGQIWGGNRPPAPNNPGYLSIAQEIQSLQQGATDGTPVGAPWQISAHDIPVGWH